jgi:carboxyl-terminal processing protease
MSKAPQQWPWVVSCVVLTLACLIQNARAADDDEYYELMRVFVDTFEQIDRNYVKDVDRRQLVEAAVRGMLSELDPYSNFISPEEITRFNEDVEQEFGGIGIQVQFQPDKGGLIVSSPLPGSPAYNAGVLAGDVIVEIEGKPVAEFPERRELQTAVELLKGKPGVEVTIGVRHAGQTEVVTIPITREIIKLQTVLGDTYNPDGSWNYMYDDAAKIGYIRLSHFSRRTGEELRTALQQLNKDGMQGLVLDLRFNPGGLLTTAVEVADLFIESGKIVSTEGRNSPDRVWSAKKFGTYNDFPIAVLINQFSASASEIVGAALQDHDRAVVIGERSWGKGSVQNVIELEAGDSALKLTTASYHRPSGKNIHRFPDAKESDEWGVVPNEGFEIKMELEQTRQYDRYRRERDVLDADGPPESDFVDPQLEKALGYLRAQISGEAPSAAEKPKDEPAAKDEKKDAAALLPFLIRQIPTASA